jgi:uncharacterized damage-inducible protein DinB
MYHADLAQLRAARNRTLETTEGLSQSQADFSPGSNVWSIGEILDHLLLSEQTNRNEIAQLVELSKSGRRPFISRTLADLNFSPAFIPRSLLPFFELPLRTLNMFLPVSVREFIVRYRVIPARNADITTPRKGKTITQLRSDLDSSIKETTSLFDRNPGLDYRAMSLDHPLLGTNNVLQPLHILASHERRHQGQIGDILRRADRPQKSLGRPS